MTTVVQPEQDSSRTADTTTTRTHSNSLDVDVEQQPVSYYGEEFIPPEEDSDFDDEEFTLVSTLDRPAQTLNLNGVTATEFFFTKPWVTPVVFENDTSEARDLDANERNFLSMLRLTLYLALAGVVVLFNYRLPMQYGEAPPKDNKLLLSSTISLALGIVFCVLSVLGLFATLNNYIQTLGGYAKQRSIVQTTPLAQLLVITSACAIFAANIIFLIYN